MGFLLCSWLPLPLAFLEKWKTLSPGHSVLTSLFYCLHRHGSQGILDGASHALLENEFGTHKEEEVMKQILEKGNVQQTTVRFFPICTMLIISSTSCPVPLPALVVLEGIKSIYMAVSVSIANCEERTFCRIRDVWPIRTSLMVLQLRIEWNCTDLRNCDTILGTCI